MLHICQARLPLTLVRTNLHNFRPPPGEAERSAGKCCRVVPDLGKLVVSIIYGSCQEPEELRPAVRLRMMPGSPSSILMIPMTNTIAQFYDNANEHFN